MLFNKAGFLKTENGGKADLPMDVIKNNQKLMLKDFAIAGLTASGGQCMNRFTARLTNGSVARCSRSQMFWDPTRRAFRTTPSQALCPV